jgi:hypothetical protein
VPRLDPSPRNETRSRWAHTYSGGFTIDVSVRLVGACQMLTTISGGDSVVTIARTATVTMSRITVSDGKATEHGGGINNEGTLTLSKSTVRDNVAGGFLPGEGGGTFNDAGRLTLAHSTVTHNAANRSNRDRGQQDRNLAGTRLLHDSRGSEGVRDHRQRDRAPL